VTSYPLYLSYNLEGHDPTGNTHMLNDLKEFKTVNAYYFWWYDM
jgi:hypothetical protein